MNYKEEMLKELAEDIKSKGFRVFIAESGTHGFYTDKELKRLVSFQVDLITSFGGNYVTDNPRQTGQGWRIAEGENSDYKGMLNTYPPQWAVGDSKWSYKTVKQYLKSYQRSSKFKELKNIEPKPFEWSELWEAMTAQPEKWIVTTEGMYQNQLEVLPPADQSRGAFLVGEAYTHNTKGEAVYNCFKVTNGVYLGRRLTRRQFITMCQGRELCGIGEGF